ncbi:hypothetical protein HYPSUDRAFT_48218 [Hypholoma sublateritium FD-334 SS-4]|uniref:Uncharacterized protein n=1 Tax=Hypholoma sublateritium (strain FD-334 SS-4) TaxID=945553 RepID=A0A0D2NG03_HYPSF|nr:hypothetical protein HYPSUDRAFT_48218 [Hypholoma sublateritium FD-334 SS-4]
MRELLEKVLAEANSQSYDQSPGRKSISPMSARNHASHQRRAVLITVLPSPKILGLDRTIDLCY